MGLILKLSLLFFVFPVQTQLDFYEPWGTTHFRCFIQYTILFLFWTQFSILTKDHKSQVNVCNRSLFTLASWQKAIFEHFLVLFKRLKSYFAIRRGGKRFSQIEISATPKGIFGPVCLMEDARLKINNELVFYWNGKWRNFHYYHNT